MYDDILKRMRGCVRSRRYVMTLHADEEMDDDGLGIFDVESAILSGEIVERQKDRDTGEAKYLVHGHTLSGEEAFVVAKLGPTEKMVIITVYLA